jgi:hypothetical protein
MAKNTGKRVENPNRPQNLAGVKIDDVRLSSALAAATQIGTEAAARQFGMSSRTLRRYRGKMAAGSRTDLTDSVRSATLNFAEKNLDLLDQAFASALSRLIKLAPDAKFGEITDAVARLGELKTTRDVLTNGKSDKSSGSGNESKEAPRTEGSASASDQLPTE